MVQSAITLQMMANITRAASITRVSIKTNITAKAGSIWWSGPCWAAPWRGADSDRHACLPSFCPTNRVNELFSQGRVQHKHPRQALLALSLRERPQYNCRHTYATLCLMTGIILLSSQINLGIACKCCCPPMPDGSVPRLTGMKYPRSGRRKWVLNRYWRTLVTL